MNRSHRRLSVVAAVLALGALVSVPLATRARGNESTDKVWGTPRAEIFEEKSGGPLVEGDSVTFLPNVAELKPGNRTHHVRLDIVAQEIEIAPDVRYQAWTFGGSVPGPVIHVREGDRINFVMRNRSDEKVSTSSPSKSDAPFLQRANRLHGAKGRDAALLARREGRQRLRLHRPCRTNLPQRISAHCLRQRSSRLAGGRVPPARALPAVTKSGWLRRQVRPVRVPSCLGRF